MLVFNDLQRIEIYDIEHSVSEDRYNTIGMVHDVLFVVYTERKENIRLISARLATKIERSIYYDTNSSMDRDQKPTEEQINQIREAAKNRNTQREINIS